MEENNDMNIITQSSFASSSSCSDESMSMVSSTLSTDTEPSTSTELYDSDGYVKVDKWHHFNDGDNLRKLFCLYETQCNIQEDTRYTEEMINNRKINIRNFEIERFGIRREEEPEDWDYRGWAKRCRRVRKLETRLEEDERRMRDDRDDRDDNFNPIVIKDEED